MNGNKVFEVNMRPAESSLVETIWQSHSRDAGEFLSIASSRWEMVVSEYEGKLYLALRGPETHPSMALCPPEGRWLGIQFRHGVYMPHLPVCDLVDNGVELPEASRRAFWLHGSTWEFPTYENADVFVNRLIREEMLVFDPVVAATMAAHVTDLSVRSVQRRFLRATGLTLGAVSQIERAHEAVALLRQGTSILDTVEGLGYADQPHLTRSLKRLIGLTPAQLTPTAQALPLSFSAVIAQAE